MTKEQCGTNKYNQQQEQYVAVQDAQVVNMVPQVQVVYTQQPHAVHTAVVSTDDSEMNALIFLLVGAFCCCPLLLVNVGMYSKCLFCSRSQLLIHFVVRQPSKPENEKIRQSFAHSCHCYHRSCGTLFYINLALMIKEIIFPVGGGFQKIGVYNDLATQCFCFFFNATQGQTQHREFVTPFNINCGHIRAARLLDVINFA